MPTRSARLTIRALLACVVFAPAAIAAPPPEGVVSKPSLSAQDRTAIGDWANQIAQDLRSGEYPAVSAARDDLIRALTRDTSVAFRLEVSGALIDTLRTLARGDDEIRAFNAFQIAGALATDAAADLLVTTLRSDSPTIRYGGALGSRILFQQFVAGRSPLTQEEIAAHMGDLAQTLASERDPVVAEGLMTSFGVQFATPRARAAALRMMDDAVVELIGSLREENLADAAWTRAVVRAVDSSRRLLLDLQVSGQSDPEFARSAAQLGGHGLSFGLDLLEDAGNTNRAETNDLLRASETVLLQVYEAFVPSRSNEPEEIQQNRKQQILDALERGNTAGVRTAADRWIGQNGLLYRAPFNLPAGSLNP